MDSIFDDIIAEAPARHRVWECLFPHNWHVEAMWAYNLLNIMWLIIPVHDKHGIIRFLFTLQP